MFLCNIEFKYETRYLIISSHSRSVRNNLQKHHTNTNNDTHNRQRITHLPTNATQ